MIWTRSRQGCIGMRCGSMLESDTSTLFTQYLIHLFSGVWRIVFPIQIETILSSPWWWCSSYSFLPSHSYWYSICSLVNASTCALSKVLGWTTYCLAWTQLPRRLLKGFLVWYTRASFSHPVACIWLLIWLIGIASECPSSGIALLASKLMPALRRGWSYFGRTDDIDLPPRGPHCTEAWGCTDAPVRHRSLVAQAPLATHNRTEPPWLYIRQQLVILRLIVRVSIHSLSYNLFKRKICSCLKMYICTINDSYLRHSVVPSRVLSNIPNLLNRIARILTAFYTPLVRLDTRTSRRKKTHLLVVKLKTPILTNLYTLLSNERLATEGLFTIGWHLFLNRICIR